MYEIFLCAYNSSFYQRRTHTHMIDTANFAYTPHELRIYIRKQSMQKEKIGCNYPHDVVQRANFTFFSQRHISQIPMQRYSGVSFSKERDEFKNRKNMKL